jgi:hypothetical protein
VTRDQLVGRWTDINGSQTWDFRRGDGTVYELVYADQQGRDGRFVVHLTEISDELFMDLYPVDADPVKPGFFNLHRVPMHTFFRVGLTDHALTLSFLQPEWLKQNRAEIMKKLPHVQRDERSLLLTATTAQLREFVGQHLDTADAFTKPYTLNKAVEQ